MTSYFMPDDLTVERLAQLAHAHYLDRLAERNPDEPAHRPWDALSPSDQERNRAQVRDNVTKLWSIGLGVSAEEPNEDQVAAEIPSETLERLGRDEHTRWLEQRKLNGYRYGPERVDVGPDKRHPCMVAWEDLDDDMKERDLNPIRLFPQDLAAVGLWMVRR